MAASERIDVLDILRGFALLGILAVNMALFSAPMIGMVLGTPRGTGPLDRAAEFVIAWLAEGKFYPLFSFLFGLGMTLQMARIQERGGKAGRFMARRLFWLMLFGLAHALLIWNGDILFIYALTGFVFLLFRNTKPQTALAWAIVLMALVFVLGLTSAASSLMLGGAAMPSSGDFDPTAFFNDLQQRAVETYARGTWGETFVWRAVEWLVFLVTALFSTGPHVLAFFLFGMYFGKRGIFQALPEHLALFRRGLRIGLGVGLPANALIAWTGMTMTADDAFGAPLMSLGAVLLLVFGPVLTFGYISAFVLLTQNEAWRKRLSPMAAAGRMALSNYIMQSVVCTLIFNSYGFGLYGSIGALAGLLLSLGVWLIQLPLSMLWLSRFRFGPLEWLWRTLTYGKAQPMSKAHGSSLMTHPS